MGALAPFTLHRAATLDEAVALLAALPGARVLAGGTDLIANMRNGLAEPAALVDVTMVAGFARIAVDAGGGATLGAGIALAQLANDPAIAGAFPALAQAAAAVAGPAHRHVATLGGNLCVDTRCVFYNQSEWWRRSNAYCLKHGGDTCHVAPQGEHCHAAFSGDVAPALIALDADVELRSAEGVRRMALTEMYADDGAHPFTLRAGEIIAAVHLPRQPKGARSAYRKARVRGAIDFPLAGVAARIATDAGRLTDVRIALTGTNSRPILLDGTAALLGHTPDAATIIALGKLVQKQASPMRTTITASNYRRQVAVALARRLLGELAGPGGASG